MNFLYSWKLTNLHVYTPVRPPPLIKMLELFSHPMNLYSWQWKKSIVSKIRSGVILYCGQNTYVIFLFFFIGKSKSLEMGRKKAARVAIELWKVGTPSMKIMTNLQMPWRTLVHLMAAARRTPKKVQNEVTWLEIVVFGKFNWKLSKIVLFLVLWLQY